jgi:transposase-like protein
MARKRGLTPAKQFEVVMKLLRREDTAVALARKYGISEQTLYRYRDNFLEGAKAGLQNGKSGGKDNDRVRELEKEVEQRDQVIGELTIANRILKKMSDGF